VSVLKKIHSQSEVKVKNAAGEVKEQFKSISRESNIKRLSALSKLGLHPLTTG